MRIRTLKPEWLDDEKLNDCSDAARVLSAGLILLADDHGRGRAGVGYVAGHVWSSDMLRVPRRTFTKTSRALTELVEIRYVTLYEVSGQHYFEIRNWPKHQRVDHPGKPRVPAPLDETRETVAQSSRDSSDTLAPDLDHDLDHDLDQEANTVRDVWELFLAERKRAHPSTKALKLDQKKRANIKARLEDYGPERVQATVRKFFDARYWWAQNKKSTPDLVFRSCEQFEKVEDAGPVCGKGDTAPGPDHAADMHREIRQQLAERTAEPPPGQASIGEVAALTANLAATLAAPKPTKE
jgi:hypothetical protein